MSKKTRKGAKGYKKANYIEFNDKKDEEYIRVHGKRDLWLEADDVYGEYIVGKPEADDDVGDTIQEMMDGLPNPTNLFKFKDGAPAGSLDDVLKNAYVRVLNADAVLIHDGNVYDFGGWEYSVGNGYSEEHMNEDAVLNRVEAYDLADKGGPHWEKMDVYKNALDYKGGHPMGSKPGASDIMIGEEKNWKKDDNDDTHVWVEKSYGNSYSYKNGHEIEVKKGDSLEISHGKKSVELRFRGDGSMSAWSWSAGGVSKEKKWNDSGILTYHSESDANNNTAFEKKWTDGGTLTYHSTSGEGTSTERKYCRQFKNTMLSYSTSYQGHASVSSHSFEWANTASSSFSFSAAASFKFSASASLSLDTSLAFDISLAFKAAGKIEITKSAGPFISITNSAVDIKIPGLRVKTPDPVVLELSVADIKKKVAELKKTDAKIEKAGASITSPILKIFV